MNNRFAKTLLLSAIAIYTPIIIWGLILLFVDK